MIDNFNTNHVPVILFITKTYLSSTIKKNSKYTKAFVKKKNRYTIDLEYILKNSKINIFEFEFEKDEDCRFSDRLLKNNREILKTKEWVSTHEIKAYIASDIKQYELKKMRKNGDIPYKTHKVKKNYSYAYKTSKAIEYFEKRKNKLDEQSVFVEKCFVTLKEYKRMYSLNTYQVKKKIQENKLPCVRIGNVLRIPIKEARIPKKKLKLLGSI